MSNTLKLLPSLRKGITIQFGGYEQNGIPQWLIYDPGRNKFFAVGFLEHAILSRWHLKDPNKIIEAVNAQTVLSVDAVDIENLYKFLENNYLIEQSGSAIYQKAKDQKIIKTENLFYWFVRYYLFFKIPLFHADRFLTRTKKIADIFFSRYTLYLMIFLGFFALYQIGEQWETFKNTFSSIISWQGFVFYIIGFTIAKFFHELGHAYRCKQYGIPVPTLGIAFLVFWPVLYTDTTLSWTLPSRQRLRIALAGLWVETYVVIIAALIWANVHNITIQMVCYLIITVNWAASLLINASPFMRFDGYYILSDFLKIPNLQLRSFALARWQIRYWLFGLENPPHEFFPKKMHWVLIVYAFLTWAYRLVIYLGIALLVYHLFTKVLGILLFVFELFLFVFSPIYSEFKVWYGLKKEFSWNQKTIITVTASTVLLLWFILPLNTKIALPATFSYNHEFLFAPEDAIVESILLKKGSEVDKDQAILTLASPQINYQLKKALLEYEILSVKIRRASLSQQYVTELLSLKSDLAQKKSEIDKLQAQKNELILRAPFSGKITEISDNVYPGVVVKKDQMLVDVIDPKIPQIQAYATPDDFDKLSSQSTGVFYPESLSVPKVAVRIVAIEPLNITQLHWHYSKKLIQEEAADIVVDTPSYLSSDLGGKIPTNTSEKGELVPVDSLYSVFLRPEKPYSPDSIQRGTVVLYTKPYAYIDNVFYLVKKAFVKESSF